MNLPALSIKRPVFVTCLFFVILVLGILSWKRLDVGLYPDVTFPVVNIIVPYPGAGPQEIENQVAKPIEDALSALSGLRTLRSSSLEGAGVVTAVFTMDTDIRFAEQKVIQTLSSVRANLPRDILEPIVRTVDPMDTPVAIVSLTADLPEGELFDLADRQIRPLIEQVPQVGLVQVQGARKREIQIELDEKKLRARQMSAEEVVARVGAGGMNVPAGTVETPGLQTVVRTLGQYDSLETIRDTVIRFVGDESATTLGEIATVKDGLEDEHTRVYVNGKRAVSLNVFRQSGGNTVAVADLVAKRLKEINSDFASRGVKGFELSLIHDGAKPIRDSIRDATESIGYGVLLTVIVVLFFLGNFRSTFITAIALPNSLFGAFLLMWAAGFTVNITTLAALSLAVGLLVDDAIVVRENIFRWIESGAPPAKAAVLGTQEVTLAVVATTLTVLSVFGPTAFLKGLIGQFFRQFGLTICFAMLISLLDSLTMAPMLSAYFAGAKHSTKSRTFRLLERFHFLVEQSYLRVLRLSLRAPLLTLLFGTAVFGASFLVLRRIPLTLLPPQETGEFQVTLSAKPGTSLEAMDSAAGEIDRKLRAHAEVYRTVVTIGGENGETNQATLLTLLKPARERKLSTIAFKEVVRGELASFANLTPKIQDMLDIGGGAGQPYVLNLSGDDLERLKVASDSLLGVLGRNTDLIDVDSNYRIGAPELRVVVDRKKAELFGVSPAELGHEMRILIAGVAPARLHSGGSQYDIRVRLAKSERDLSKTFSDLYIPNLNHRMIPLSSVTSLHSTQGPSVIYREGRRRFVQLTADVAPNGRGLASALEGTRVLLRSGQVKLSPDMRYEFSGQTKDFEELMGSIVLALALSVASMYVVLASLYESFFVPFSIMLVLPLAVCGAFYAMWLWGAGLDLYSIIGCLLLLGVAAKNSILLVDNINEGVRAGKVLRTAILEAGKVRLRPILMTSFALIAGMMPVALPLQESARQRTGMAIAVIGGLISSTLLTLVVVPAAYGYIEGFQSWVRRGLARLTTAPETVDT